MKNILNRDLSKRTTVIFWVFVFLSVVFLLLLRKFIISAEAQDQCSIKGERVTRNGGIWGPEEVENCMGDYKRGKH